MKAVKCGKVSPPVSYDSVEGQILISLLPLIVKIDNNPFNPTSTHLSPWLRCIFSGNFKEFMDYLAGKTEEEVKRLVLKRETFGNFGPLHQVIHGAKESRSLEDCMKIFEKLIVLGAPRTLWESRLCTFWRWR